MTSVSTAFPRLLWLLVPVLCLAACAKSPIGGGNPEQQAFDELRAAVSDTIDDVERGEAVVALVNQLENDLAELRSTIEERKSRVRAINANYDATREEFDAYLAHYAAQLRENRKRVTETHLAFRAAITADEAETIARVHTAAMKTAIASMEAM